MLKANPPAEFFDYGNTGLDGDACRLILSKMDDPVCARFLGNPAIGYDFCETTAAHTVRTYQTLESILTKVLPDNAQRAATLNHHKAMITLHDMSDIIKEVIIATTEVNPELKAKCSGAIHTYDQTVTPFTYKLALFANTVRDHDMFNETIDEIRDATLYTGQHERGFTFEEALAFSANAVRVINQAEKQFSSRYRQWNTPEVAQKTATMMGYFNEIETQSSFEGLQSHIHEKCDGTTYSLQVSNQKTALGLTPTVFHAPSYLVNRINGRFEKQLGTLVKKAGDDPIKLAAAAATINHCFNVSKTAFTMGKPLTSMNPIPNEPTEDDAHAVHTDFVERQFAALNNKPLSREEIQKSNIIQPEPLIMANEVVELYRDAMMDLKFNNVLWVPEQGKTLLESGNKVQKMALPKNLAL